MPRLNLRVLPQEEKDSFRAVFVEQLEITKRKLEFEETRNVRPKTPNPEVWSKGEESSDDEMPELEEDNDSDREEIIEQMEQNRLIFNLQAKLGFLENAIEEIDNPIPVYEKAGFEMTFGAEIGDGTNACYFCWHCRHTATRAVRRVPQFIKGIRQVWACGECTAEKYIDRI